MDCFLCQKHQNLVASPPGVHIFEGEHWLLCHAPIEKGALGTLFLESRRHFLDFSESNQEELRTYGPLLKRVYAALKSLTDPERIYMVIFMEGIPHFHAWLIPRRAKDAERGVAFLAKDIAGNDIQAENLALKLRKLLEK